MASLIAALALLIMTGSAVGAQFEPAEPQDGCEYFEDTQHNLCEPFLSYWNENGGLEVFGYSISEAFQEENPDLGVELLTQYFERERMEHHPENEGTEYEILLGRLGAQILDLNGVNWHAFPKADPSEEHYAEVTGQAIAPEFWEYWSSHGLDLGDEGISYRESLALFGYPISPLQTETNSSGDTVPTQWFERARFELHEGGVVLLGLLGNELVEMMAPPTPPPAVGEVIAEGLNNPRGIEVASDGSVYVAEAGVGGDDCRQTTHPTFGDIEACFGETGAITHIADGSQERVVSGLPSWSNEGEVTGPHDVVVADDVLYFPVGLGGTRDWVGSLEGVPAGFGTIMMANGEVTSILDVAAYEAENNPDGGVDDSNPYSAAAAPDGGWVISDAGMNALLHVSAEGEISTLAVFEPRMVTGPDGSEVPMQAVPTGVTVGPDGAYYVGQLTGFPFPVGGANVYRVTAEGDVEVYAEGFTNVIDVAFDSAGNLYVLEMLNNGLLSADPADPSTAAAQLNMVAPDGTVTELPSQGLIFATGLAVGPDNSIYVSNFGVMPGLGQVVKIAGQTTPPPPPSDGLGTVLAEGLASPRGIYIEGDVIYVAEAGAGGEGPCVPGPEGDEVCVGVTGAVTGVNGSPTQVITGLPSVAAAGGVNAGGPHDVIPAEDGAMYVLMGLGADPARRADLGENGSLFGQILMVEADGTVTPMVDVAGYEAAANPDGGAIDSNPFRFVSDGAGGFVVTDAGANALIQISATGEASTLAVFEDRMVDAPPFLGMPEGSQIPMQAVPTGVAIGPDGAYYVGELTGFPFQPGSARVWRVTPDGETEVYAEGFTNIVDVAFDAEGNLYVLEIAAGSLLNVNPEDPSTLQGRLVMVAPDGTQTTIADEGLITPTGLAIGADGSILISNSGTVAGLGELVLLDAAS